VLERVETRKALELATPRLVGESIFDYRRRLDALLPSERLARVRFIDHERGVRR